MGKTPRLGRGGAVALIVTFLKALLNQIAMIRFLFFSLVIVGLFTLGVIVYILVQQRKAFVKNFETRSVVTKIFNPYQGTMDYKMMEFADGRKIGVPDRIYKKVKIGDSVIKLVNQTYLVWISGHQRDTIEL